MFRLNTALVMKKIGVFLPNKKFLGANLLLFPFFLKLRKIFPKFEIKTISVEEKSNIFYTNDLVDEFMWLGHPFSLKKATSIVRSENFSYWINLRAASTKNHLLSALSGSWRKTGLVNSPLERVFYNKSFVYNPNIYRERNYNLILRSLSKKDIPTNREVLIQHYKLKASTPSKEHFVFIIGAGDPRKVWPLEKFIELSHRTIKKFPMASIDWILGPEERSCIKKLENLGSQHHVHLSPSIAKLFELQLNATLTVAGDCGPAHCSHLLNAPLISLWGWHKGNPAKTILEWSPERENHRRVLAPEGEEVSSITVENVWKTLVQQNRF